jgi:cell division control protein 7
MFSLLSCLGSIHKCGIIHRDLKPDNFLYDIDTHKCLLIDFGLSEYEIEEGNSMLSFKKSNSLSLNNMNNNFEDEDLKIIQDIQKTMGIKHRIGTRGFLPPEVILNARHQGKAVDIWAAGVIFLCFFTKRMPVFNLNKFSKITDETIREVEPLIILFGPDKIREIAQKHQNLIFIPEIFNKCALLNDIEAMRERSDIDADGVDLLRRMLELDCDKRITAEQAKLHPFFHELNMRV